METDAAHGLRQRKRDELRRAIIAEAMQLFFERGYDVTTVEEIVAGLNISPRTFFRYFKSKEEVVVAGPLHAGTRVREFASLAPTGTAPLEIARSVARRMAESRQSLPEGLRHTTLILETPELAARLAHERERWARDLAGALESRLDGADVALHARILASSAIGSLSAAAESWVGERGARPLPEILERAFALLDAAHDERRDAAA